MCESCVSVGGGCIPISGIGGVAKFEKSLTSTVMRWVEEVIMAMWFQSGSCQTHCGLN
jgi:hypothetical protein